MRGATCTARTAGGADRPRQARQVTLPPAPRAAGLARQEVRDALASWGLDRLEDTAVLLATELVGNAGRHARHGGSDPDLRTTDPGPRPAIQRSYTHPSPPPPHHPAQHA